MEESFTLRVIAHIHNDYKEKFGIPRQSGLGTKNLSYVCFEPAYRDENALRGLEGYSHLWLIWGFSAFKRQERFVPMVKPPRLGGNTSMGVFATRSPNRPNPLGLSSVRLLGIEKRPHQGSVLVLEGADLMDGTPIYDIKPYLSFTDAHPEAVNGFSDECKDYKLQVEFPAELLKQIPQEKQQPLLELLSQDPRPGYLRERDCPYGFAYGAFDVRFRVKEGVLRVYELIDC